MRGLAPRRQCPRNEILDHRLQPEFHAVMRVVNPLDAVVHERSDFIGRDRAATTTEDPDVFRTELTQSVDHVTEELVMPALVGADGDAVGIFLDRRLHNVFDAAIVPEMHNFDALRLDQAAHYVNRRIVPVEQRRRGHEAQGVLSRSPDVRGKSVAAVLILQPEENFNLD